MSLNQDKYFAAVEAGDTLNVLLCLQSGVDVNASDHINRTGIMIAVEYTHEHIVDVFLDHGADIYLRDGGGQTVFYYAQYFEQYNIMDELLNAGFDINRPIARFNTALHWAIRQQKEDVVDYLLSRGANPDFVVDGEQSALDLVSDLMRTEGINKYAGLRKKLMAHVTGDRRGVIRCVEGY